MLQILGGGGVETVRGEREGRAAARGRSSEYGWNIVTGYEGINKERNPGQLLRQICILGAFIIEWGIHSVTEPASDFSPIPLVGNRCAPPRVKIIEGEQSPCFPCEKFL